MVALGAGDPANRLLLPEPFGQRPALGSRQRPEQVRDRARQDPRVGGARPRHVRIEAGQSQLVAQPDVEGKRGDSGPGIGPQVERDPEQRSERVEVRSVEQCAVLIGVPGIAVDPPGSGVRDDPVEGDPGLVLRTRFSGHRQP